MSIFPTNSVSAYLLPPDSSPSHPRSWARLRRTIIRTLRTNPGIIAKTFAILSVWTGFFASVQYVTTPHSLAGQSPLFIGQAPSLSSTAPAALTRAVPAGVLPSGPAGTQLPPGTMAPRGTYANSYTRGQCTWYVAGRRQVPSNWGHARSWYYHASATGWKVGSTPAVAAIAWTSAGTYGHVALVEQVSADGKQVYISEMNYRGAYVVSYRWVNSTAFKYIY